MAAMTKCERVMAALRGDAVDRPPFSFWSHNYAKENSAQDLADETLRVGREFDFDFLKPQSRAQCFEEAWGVVYRASGQRTEPPTYVSDVVREVEDFGKLESAELIPPFRADRPFVLGTDHVGRDVLSRIIYGTRVALLVGLASVALSGAIGITLGLASGSYGGIADDPIG